jgi:hypothetical protein
VNADGPGGVLKLNQLFTHPKAAGSPPHPRGGDDAHLAAGHAGGTLNQQTARRDLVRPQIYEITFTGQAGNALRAEFEDCEVTVGPGTTTLRAELPDQGALSGLVQRITGLGLEVIHMHLVAPPPGP